MKRFAVWTGTSIPSSCATVRDVAAAIDELAPAGPWSREWIVKAGEGGSWQATWDKHQLAITGTH